MIRLSFGSCLLIICICVSSVAYARVFDFKQLKWGSYLKGNISTSSVANSAYSDNSGSSVIFPPGAKYNWGGEIGFIYNTSTVGIRIGYELINPIQQPVDGTNSAGGVLVSLRSSVIGAFPVAHIETYLGSTDTSRFVISLGGGYGTVSLNNTYTYFISAAPYTVTGTSTTYIAELSGGYEFLMSGNVTLNFEAGYRLSPITSFTSDSTFQDIYGRTFVKGSTLTNIDNSPISMTLNGYWVGLCFTFYFVN